MKTKTIYRTENGKQELFLIYNKLTAMLNMPYKEQNITTSFGKTHLLIVGKKSAPPILFFHGGNSMTPHELLAFKELSNHFQIFAPDTIGHPGKSEEKRLRPNSYQYGKWASELIHQLGFAQTAVMGVSYGAGILLNLAAVDPDKISKAIFIVPSGFVRGSICKMTYKLALPMLRYRKNQTDENLLAALSPLDPTPSKETMELIGSVFRNVKIETGMPKIISKKALNNFKAPSLVISAAKDLLFPGKKVAQRAKDILTNNLPETVMLEDCYHLTIMKKKIAEQIIKRATSFLKDSKKEQINTN